MDDKTTSSSIVFFFITAIFGYWWSVRSSLTRAGTHAPETVLSASGNDCQALCEEIKRRKNRLLNLEQILLTAEKRYEAAGISLGIFGLTILTIVVLGVVAFATFFLFVGAMVGALVVLALGIDIIVQMYELGQRIAGIKTQMENENQTIALQSEELRTKCPSISALCLGEA